MSQGMEVLVPGVRGHFYVLSRSDGEVHMTAEASSLADIRLLCGFTVSLFILYSYLQWA